jgi:hypothetical protein
MPQQWIIIYRMRKYATTVDDNIQESRKYATTVDNYIQE